MNSWTKTISPWWLKKVGEIKWWTFKECSKKENIYSHPAKKIKIKITIKCFYLNVHRNIHLKLYPFCSSFMNEKQKRDERNGNIQNRKGVARAEEGQLMMISESLVWVICKFNENTRRQSSKYKQ